MSRRLKLFFLPRHALLWKNDQGLQTVRRGPGLGALARRREYPIDFPAIFRQDIGSRK